MTDAQLDAVIDLVCANVGAHTLHPEAELSRPQLRDRIRALLEGEAPRNPKWLPYELLDSQQLQYAVRLPPDCHLLVLQPFGWHLNGRHLPNMAEHFSRESVCDEHNWTVVCEYGPYVAIVKSIAPPAPEAQP